MFFCFFFQAEDGIRDLVRSRGLGDVYKRQRLAFWCRRGDAVALWNEHPLIAPDADAGCRGAGACEVLGVRTVSYTHLTLPTSDLV